MDSGIFHISDKPQICRISDTKVQGKQLVGLVHLRAVCHCSRTSGRNFPSIKELTQNKTESLKDAWWLWFNLFFRSNFGWQKKSPGPLELDTLAPEYGISLPGISLHIICHSLFSIIWRSFGDLMVKGFDVVRACFVIPSFHDPNWDLSRFFNLDGSYSKFVCLSLILLCLFVDKSNFSASRNFFSKVTSKTRNHGARISRIIKLCVLIHKANFSTEATKRKSWLQPTMSEQWKYSIHDGTTNSKQILTVIYRSSVRASCVAL